MNKIEEKIQECNLCPNLIKLKCNTVSYGKNKDILFIGESPSKNGWIVTGKAFYNSDNKLLPTGRNLDKLLKIIDLTIDDITFTEACKCHIPDRKMLYQTAKNCLIYLKEQIFILKPKILIPLGEFPTRVLLETESFKKFGDIAGKEFIINIKDKSFIVIPIYHPSPINPKSYIKNVPIFKKIKDIIIRSI